MAIFKCKMCGGDLNISADSKIVECEYCGTTQTVPSADSEKKMTLFNRANRLRLNSEFDKAAVLYEQIIAEFPEEAEAYWGLCLCNYGIEYVDDPATGKKIPTCHRASFQKLSEDENYQLAMEYSDAVAQRVYRTEAREIDRINEEILSVSKNEKPYDIFICYKETDDVGGRTPDSVMAQEVYDALTAKGYKVFFSRITLEDKLGLQYEPYIFAALNSAKVMLAFGTKYEYFHAVWVKNEWSRFLKLAAKDKTKKLVPVYKDMDPYDLPDEFKALQAQDMGKLGAVQDLIRGVGKLVGNHSASTEEAKPRSVGAFTKRGYIFLEDQDYKTADDYFERALDDNPEDPKAYLGKVLSALKLSSKEEMNNVLFDPDSFKNFGRAIRFSDGDEKDTLLSIFEFAKKKHLAKCFSTGISRYIRKIERKMEEERIAEEKLEKTYQVAINNEKIAEYYAAAYTFSEVEGYKDAADRAIVNYYAAAEYFKNRKKYIQAAECFQHTPGYKDADTQLDECRAVIREMQNKRIESQPVLAVGSMHIAAVRSDGTAIAVGNNVSGCCNVQDWNDIIAVAAGEYHTVGLRADGTVVSTRITEQRCQHGQGDVSAWKDVIAIAAGAHHTVGLRADGTVVAVGENNFGQCNVNEWKDIVFINANGYETCGIRADGTVLSTRLFTLQGSGFVEVCADIPPIGLRVDGTVSNSNIFRSDDMFAEWSDIIAIAHGAGYTIGLYADGTVVAASRVADKTQGACDVEGWRDIVAIAAQGLNTVGLKKDGTLVIAGSKIGIPEQTVRSVRGIRTTREYTSISGRIAYWSRHADEKKALEDERMHLEEDNRSIAMQLEQLQSDNQWFQNQSIRNLQQQIAAWTAEMNGIGIFGGKKKKELQEKIEDTKQELEKQKKVIKEELGQQIAPLEHKRSNNLARVREIDNELNSAK